MNTEKRGDLFLSNSGENYLFKQVALYAAMETTSEESLLGMQEAEKVFSTGDYFQNPNNIMLPLDVETESPRMILQYRDHLRKRVPLAGAYEVTVIVAYIEKHPEIEKIADPAERKRLYDRAISNSFLSPKSR